MKKNKPDYEALGRMLENIYESGYIDHAKTYKMSFLKGMIAGFGGVIGATIVVTLLLWFLTLFGHIPLIKPVIDNIRTTIDQKTQ